MNTSERILENIHDVTKFYDDFDSSALDYDATSGFVVATAPLAVEGMVRYLGYAAPLSRQGGINRDRLVVPITDLSEVAEQDLTTVEHRKGVGPRLYNWPAATLRQPQDIGAYVIDVLPDRLLDYAPEQGGRFTQFFSHLHRKANTATEGLEAVVARVHDAYGDASVVRLKQPVKPAMIQTLKRQSNPNGMPAAFLIVRDSSIILRKVGEYRPKGKSAPLTNNFVFA